MAAGPVTRDDVEQAAARIADRVRGTPAIVVEDGAFGLGFPIAVKLELLQHTGSFKARGAFNQVLVADIPERGVIAASGGNFALAVGYAAERLGVPATIFVPESSPAAKIERLQRSSAEVHVGGAFYAEAADLCRAHAAQTGALELHPFDNADMAAGGGTCARELVEFAPDLDTILVAVGGGGLIAGTIAAVGEDVKIVAVEPEACPTLVSALDAGEPVEVQVGGVAADSLGARRLGDIPFAMCRDGVATVAQVTDDAISGAQRELWRALRVVAEPGAAASFAALFSGAYVPDAGERVGLYVCGGNCDPASVAG